MHADVLVDSPVQYQRIGHTKYPFLKVQKYANTFAGVPSLFHNVRNVSKIIWDKYEWYRNYAVNQACNEGSKVRILFVKENRTSLC